MASLAQTDLQPPFIPPSAAPRAGLAIKPLKPTGQGRGRRPGAVSFEPPTPEVWEAIVDAFRLHVGHVVNAARRAGHGVTPAYAKYAWENGWWDVPGCEKMIPVRDVITAEIATARAIAVRQADSSPATIEASKAAAKDTVALAVNDIGEIRAAETKTLRVAQAVTQAALASTTAIKKVLPALSQRIADAIMKEKDKMPARDLLRLLRSYTEVEHLIITQANTVADMRRRLYGEADLTIAHEHTMTGDFASEEAALAELRESERLMQRFRGSNVIDASAEDVSDTDDTDAILADLDDDDDDTADMGEGDGEDDFVGGHTEDEDGGHDLSDELLADAELYGDQDDDDDDDGSGYVRRRIRPQPR